MSNSPLAPSGPANLGATPSSAGESTAGRSWMLASRQGRENVRFPRPIRPRTARVKSSRHSSAFQAGWNPQRSRRSVTSINGALCRSSSSANEVTRRSTGEPIGTMGRPSAAAMRRNVNSPGAARLTGPLSITASSSARTNSRCASSEWTTCTTRSAYPAGNTGRANSRCTQLSTFRPKMSAQRTATHSRPQSASICSTRGW
ncbi:Uncharacterised protein [Mycobacterium tuberculosis]|uniref:Uncharacterized protein n=1 Tax=Mycobacterium tuberculosis TaxID=1773 RepID=A0A655JJM3_MYCTX|nr:Uncharacterised protein [Mycobacterium tuberculosis]